MLCSGACLENFYAQEALDKGLVTEVTSEDKLLERSEEIAADFVEATSSLSVTLIRQMLWKMPGADHPMEAHKIDFGEYIHLVKPVKPVKA